MHHDQPYKKDQLVPLTEADCFMLALEKQHISRTGLSSNTCHYLLELKGRIDVDAFSKKVNSCQDILWLSSLSPEKTTPVSLPVWKRKHTIKVIPVHISETDELLPESILNRKLSPYHPPFLSFDILYRSNGDSAVVFSWHHLLMDGYGVVLLLQQLNDQRNAQRLHILDDEPVPPLRLRQLANATRAKFFVDRISRKPLTSIASFKELHQKDQKVRIIRFTADESKQIDKTGPALGAHYGRSSLYLACAARCVSGVLKKKGIPLHDFWIPVPRDQRKKGADGPLLGNHLSFLFYRLKSDDLSSLQKTVRTINEQMMHQVRSGMSRDYDILMRFLKRTPSPLYYFWIKGPHGGSLATFLFTVAADHPDNFTTFEGHPVRDAWSFPSNIYPPGLTFAFMRFRENVHLMILHFEDVISTAEVDAMEAQIRKELLTGKETNA